MQVNNLMKKMIILMIQNNFSAYSHNIPIYKKLYVFQDI